MQQKSRPGIFSSDGSFLYLSLYQVYHFAVSLSSAEDALQSELSGFGENV